MLHLFNTTSNRVNLYSCKSASDIAARCVPKKSNLMFTLIADNDQRRKKTSRSLSLTVMNLYDFYRRATKFRQGDVFTPVCDSVHRVEGLYPAGSLSKGSLCPREGLCPWGSLSGGLCPVGFCPMEFLSRGLCLGVSVQGVSVQEDPPTCRRTVVCGWYAPCWNAFLSLFNFSICYKTLVDLGFLQKKVFGLCVCVCVCLCVCVFVCVCVCFVCVCVIKYCGHLFRKEKFAKTI